MSDEVNYKYFQNKLESKTYISKRITDKSPIDENITINKRIASKVFNSKEEHKFAIEKDRLIVRVTDGGKQEIIAKFYEDNRGIHTLTFQKYTQKSGKPHALSFSFVNDEIQNIINFLSNLKSIDLSSPLKINITDEKLQEILLNKEQVQKVINSNKNLILELAKNEITEEDIISLGYRKKQLKLFKEMLQNDNLNESDWQQFFEKNNWIFGYGLSYIFHNGLDEKKLEQVVSGFDFNSSGKRVDALLKTAGFINSLCFVEIKTHKTDLLKNKPYRVGCWAVSDELLGGIAQIQNTVSLNLKKFYGKTQMKDKTSGDITGEEFFSFQPKSFLIIGSLSQLIGSNAPNEDKFRSFELFRKNTLNPEIITFDELYERAKFIIDSKNSNHE